MVAHIGKLPDMLPAHVYRVVFKSDEDHQLFVTKFNGKCQLLLDEVATDAYVSDRTVSTTDVRVSYFPPDWSLEVLKARLKGYGATLSVERELYNDSSMAKWKKVASTLAVQVKMVLEKPIPSYVTIGEARVFVQYRGQAPTCRLCDSAQHKIFECPNRKANSAPVSRGAGNKPVAPKPVAPVREVAVAPNPNPSEVRPSKVARVDQDGFQLVPYKRNRAGEKQNIAEKDFINTASVAQMQDLLLEAEQLGVLVTVPAEAEPFYEDDDAEGDDPKRGKKKSGQTTGRKKDLRSKETRDILKMFGRTYAAATQAEAADFPQAQQWVAQVDRALTENNKAPRSNPDIAIIPDSLPDTISPTYIMEFIAPQLEAMTNVIQDPLLNDPGPSGNTEGEPPLLSSGQSSGIPAGQAPREIPEDPENVSQESEMDLTS